ncbi:hypothetical protein TELCIR_21547, partial [Teladorsagia circumcincta]
MYAAMKLVHRQCAERGALIFAAMKESFNIARIQDGMGDKMGLLIRGFAMFFSSITACCAINWQITLISLTMGPIAAMTMAMLGR